MSDSPAFAESCPLCGFALSFCTCGSRDPGNPPPMQWVENQKQLGRELDLLSRALKLQQEQLILQARVADALERIAKRLERYPLS